MLSRRDVLTGGVLLLAAGPACARSKAITWPRRTKHDGVDFIELFPASADESSPLIVGIHGMGDRPDAWIETWSTFPSRAQIALPRAFARHGEGYSWFEFKDGMTDEEYSREVGAAEDKLWKGIEKLAGARRVIVTGFSQGGILSFVIAARHPDKVAYAFPVGGSAPGGLLPKDKAKTAPVIAFHGTADTTLQFKWAEGSVNAFKEQGNSAEMRAYPGVGHAMTTQMRADLWAELQKVVAATK